MMTATATSMLSPHASPFIPSSREKLNFIIHNSGVPSSVLVGSNPAHEIIHNIPDDAIDEVFPPTAQDAAELDAADDFVNCMVDISFLEETDERARADFNHIRKRWEARREEGLRTKPYPATGNLKPIIHGLNSFHIAEDTAVIKEGHLDIRAANLAHRSRKDMIARHNVASKGNINNKAKVMYGDSRLIQQPRKHN